MVKARINPYVHFKGGQIKVPLADSHWGSSFGMFRDTYDIEWMVDYDPKYNRE